MDRMEIRDRIVLAMLPHASFDGWGDQALAAALADADLSNDMANRVFPGGMREILGHWSSHSDQRMAEELAARHLEPMRIRDRAALAIRVRIEVNLEHREAVRRALSFLALPQNAEVGVRCTYHTVNAMWYAAGDTSSDYTFYTRRALLAAVYGAAILYWLDDDSEDYDDTWSFISRRMEDVMRISDLQSRLTSALQGFASPLSGRMGRRFRTLRPD